MAASADPAPAADACPVDHKSRQAWLEQAAKARSNPPDSSSPAAPHALPPNLQPGRLSNDREISTIPRTLFTSSASSPLPPPPPSATATVAPDTASLPVAPPAAASHGRLPANAEHDTGADAKSGNWIYPSEQMFFSAMKRKNFAAQESDMRAIIPIHNAVNEKAWAEIRQWEQGQGSEKCGGPRLTSFEGNSTALTPKARINTLLGYAAPFDRHDWVIDRCGKRVDYVIDFYAGKDEGKPGKSLNFYLDVRPKLNTWEGWRLRIGKFVGLG